jgi:hypothetical protein
VTDSTASSSTSTGALKVSGGAGIVGNVFAGNVLATGFFYANGTPFTSSSYSNTTVASYLPVYSGSIGAASEIVTLTANAGAQSNQIAGANAAIITANTALKSYVDTQDSAITSAWTSNAGAQADQITGANAVVATLQANVGSFYTYANATFGASGYGNTDVASYLPTYTGSLAASSDITALYANAGAQSDSLAGANAAIITANTALKSYVDTQDSAITTAWTANAGAQASSIATLTANAGAQSDAIALKAPIAGPSFTGNVGISGNIVGGNISTGGAITTSANITGNYFLGNGALLTGVITSATSINSGTSNVSVISSGGPVTIGVGGTSNVAVFANTGLTVTGVINSTGNVTGGNVIVNGSGTPTVSSATNLDLSAASAVRVIGGGSFRLPTLTTLQIANLTAANGDMVYNSTTSKIQAYANSAWGNITLS